MQITARRYDTGESVSVHLAEGRIAAIAPAINSPNLPWVAPGFVDLQINGYRGQEFNDNSLDVGKVEQVCSSMDADGLSGFLATCTTHSYEMLAHAMQTMASACSQSTIVARRLWGIHLEGPYISAEDGPRGAHPRQHCRPPVWHEFQRLQDAAGGRIRLITVSPEYPDMPSFITRAVSSGVLVAIGHTAADSQQIQAAVDAGARMSTHLGNGAHGQIRRHPNYIWDQLGDDRLTASLIADGHHLPASVVKSMIRAKTPERCVLVSDITGMGGMPPGHYPRSSLGDVEVLEDGRLVVAGQRQYLAGAALPITHCVATVMRYGGVNLKTAIEMASVRPAELIGVFSQRLAVGAAANLVLFELPATDAGPIQVRATVLQGELVWGSC